MPDLQPQASSGSTISYASKAAQRGDSLYRLTKMSTTAGLGSGDYVAINTLAIASTLLGLGSLIVPLMMNDLLQVIPLAALVSGIVAWRQIQRSNGTQTGRGLAAAGILLALLIGGGTLVAKAVTAWKYAPETREIVSIVEKVGTELEAAGAATPPPSTQPNTQPIYGPVARSAADMDRFIEMNRHYRNAYRLFSDKFRTHVSEDRFIEVWTQINRSTGGVKSLEWNGQINFLTDTGSGRPQAALMTWLRLKNSNEVLREGMLFTKEADKWEIDEVPNLFQEQKGPKKK